MLFEGAHGQHKIAPISRSWLHFGPTAQYENRLQPVCVIVKQPDLSTTQQIGRHAAATTEAVHVLERLASGGQVAAVRMTLQPISTLMP